MKRPGCAALGMSGAIGVIGAIMIVGSAPCFPYGLIDPIAQYDHDDGIAVVSYVKDGGLVHHITARHNVIVNNRWGRQMSVPSLPASAPAASR